MEVLIRTLWLMTTPSGSASGRHALVNDLARSAQRGVFVDPEENENLQGDDRLGRLVRCHQRAEGLGEREGIAVRFTVGASSERRGLAFRSRG